MKEEIQTNEKQEKRLNKDRKRWENWKAKYYALGISGISKANSDLIMQYLKDMEIGLNVSIKVPKGPRSERRLTDIREKMTFFAKRFEEIYGISDLTKVSEEQVAGLFYGMQMGEFKTKKGENYKSVETFSRIFKAFWHWWMKSNKKKKVIIEDITEDINAKQGKPVWVYLPIEEVRILADSMKKFEYKVLIIFLMDSGIRAPYELLNVKVSDLSNDCKELQIRVHKKKSFPRKIKLLLCSDLLNTYIRSKGLKSEDYLFQVCPEVVNRNLQKASKALFGEGLSPAGEKYSKITMYDFRHCACCYWLPRYKSESALKYRFGWKKSDKIHYYSELLGMRDTISEEDLLIDTTKTELENRLTKVEQENKILVERVIEFEKYMRIIDKITQQIEAKITKVTLIGQ